MGRYDTPLYVYSRGRGSARAWPRASGRAFRKREPLICYALKANSNRAVCAVLARAGAGADIVSGGELVRALRAGFAPAKTVFSGVGKTEEEMAAGLRAGLLTFNVESGEELDALARVAGRLKRVAPVSVRLNPDVNPRTHPHITTGTAENKFGVETAEAFALYRRAARDKRLRVVGIQCHIGSQITDLEPYRLAAASVIALLSNRGTPLCRQRNPSLAYRRGGRDRNHVQGRETLGAPRPGEDSRRRVLALARRASPAGTGTLPRSRRRNAPHARAVSKTDLEAALRYSGRRYDGPASPCTLQRMAPRGSREASRAGPASS